jgi:hypothetical protein
MSLTKNKKSRSTTSSWPVRIFSRLLGPGRTATIAAVMIAIFFGGALVAWLKLSPKILASGEYRVGAEQIAITPLPSWLHRKPGEFQAEVFRDLSLDRPLSIVDEDLVERVKTAFMRNPWVSKVNRVEKRHPAAVIVELEWRRPVCMVEVPRGVLAVDIDGYILPSKDFTPLETKNYPPLAGMDHIPEIPEGSRWVDSKVLGGAEIAAALGPVWKTMKLERIVPLAADPAVANPVNDTGRRLTEPFFILLTPKGRRILWGYAPGANIVGELSSAEKVARLQRYFAAKDTLDDPLEKNQDLDIRKLGVGP